MNNDSHKSHGDEGLSPVIDGIEKDTANFFRKNPDALWPLLVLALLVIASPLAVFWLVSDEQGKNWSEMVKNVVESGAVLAAVFAAIKWVNERRDRATDVLLNLEKEFKEEKVMAGRNAVEDSDHSGAEGRCDKLDAMLRFYVVLYGVYIARQVPEKSLSICFRYWLAHYFRQDRTKFRDYVDRSYPTLKGWLRKDCREECPFFSPKPLFREKTDEGFIKKCIEENNT